MATATPLGPPGPRRRRSSTPGCSSWTRNQGSASALAGTHRYSRTHCLWLEQFQIAEFVRLCAPDGHAGVAYRLASSGLVGGERDVAADWVERHAGVGHVSFPEARLGAGGGTSRPAPGPVRSGSGGKVAGVMRGEAVKAASLTLRRGPAMLPGHMIMDFREPHLVGQRRRAVLAEGRMRDGVRDPVILWPEIAAAVPGHRFQRVHLRRGMLGADRSDGALRSGGSRPGRAGCPGL
jgi:hypothetical protein